jgi:transposase-like protein
MKARSTYQIMQDMKATEQAKEDIAKAKVVHPDTLARVFEMQQERVPCTFCQTITKTDVHVDYNGGISVFTKYVCPKCTHEFMEKDIPR